jgi:predicted DCC family thiol-disulfide oxidoreductase YuxK
VDFRDNGKIERLGEFDFTRAEREILVDTGDGWLGGFRAFRWTALRLPLLWPLIPILYLPGITLVGDRIYSWIAARRYTFLGRTCEEGVCFEHKS